MKGVTSALDDDVALDGHADQSEVADQVEDLVPHELVGPAEAVAVEHAALVHHHGVVEIAAAGETVAPQGLYLVEEAEGARPTDLALEALSAQRESLECLATDGGMGVVDGVADPERATGIDADRPLAIANLDGLADAHPPALGSLVEDAGGADQEDEGCRTPVHHRDLGPVDLDAHVVDAQAVEGGEQVFDGADRRVAAAESGGVGRGRHGPRLRGNLDGMRQVGAHEDDSRVRPGRVQGQLDGLTRVKSDARTRDLLCDGTLIQRPSPPWTIRLRASTRP